MPRLFIEDTSLSAGSVLQMSCFGKVAKIGVASQSNFLMIFLADANKVHDANFSANRFHVCAVFLLIDQYFDRKEISHGDAGWMQLTLTQNRVPEST